MQAEPDTAKKTGRTQFIRHGYPLWATLFGALIVCAVGLVAIMQTEPKVVVEGGSAYLAGVISSHRLSHDFVIDNPHPYSVTVQASSEGCACTTTRLDQTTLGPFRRMPVHVDIDAEDNGPQTEGAKITTSHAGRTAETWLFVSYDKKQNRTQAKGL